MSAGRADRLEMRVPAEMKERLRQAAEAQGVTLTRFAIEALTHAADEVLKGRSSDRRVLGWAAGTAREVGDIVAPVIEADEWSALAK